MTNNKLENIETNEFNKINEIKQVTKADVFWNMLGSLLSAASSFLLLLFVTRYAGVNDGGIFSLAYSTAQILLTIGKFGVRSFQATDVKNEISFGTYLKSRYLFSIAMLFGDLLYVILAGYSLNKSLIFIFVCIIKMVDALEDVFHGQLQKNDRLALAGKLLTIRNLITIFCFAMSIIISKNLFYTNLITAILSLIVGVCGNYYFAGMILKSDIKNSYKSSFAYEIRFLLKQCSPLFIGSFLSLLIYNIPKYVIDFWGTDDQIACYTILFMPTFVINMISDFIFKPLLTTMAYDWEHKGIKRFCNRIFKLLCGIVVLMIFAMVMAYFLGTMVLSWFYAVDVNAYRKELCILMLGGGFSAVVYLLYNVLTCMRKQRQILIGYMIGTVIIAVLAIMFMPTMGIMGQTIAYLITEIVLSIYMLLMLIFGIQKIKK